MKHLLPFPRSTLNFSQTLPILPALFPDTEWDPRWGFCFFFMGNSWLRQHLTLSLCRWQHSQDVFPPNQVFFPSTSGIIELFSFLSSSAKHWQENLSKGYFAIQLDCSSNRFIRANSKNLNYFGGKWQKCLRQCLPWKPIKWAQTGALSCGLEINCEAECER